MAPAADPSHIVAVPYPGRGHINAMMNSSRLLAAGGVAVTFVVTEEWLGLLSAAAAEPAPVGVRLHTIPNVIPSEHGRAADHAGFLDAVSTQMEAPLERLLDVLERPPAAIVADTYMPWVVGVGSRRGVPVCSLFPMAAAFFSVYLHLDRLRPWLASRQTTADSAATDNSDQRVEHYIPGITSIRLSDLEPLIHNERTVKHVLAGISSAKKAQCLLLTTAYELEASVVDALRAELSCPVYPIGPCIPYMALQERNAKPGHEDYFAWLDSQPVNSVLYVSLGSFLSVSPSQLDEMAMGLAASGASIFWILREQSPRVRELIGSTSKGMVLPWCDQLKVLCHPSVGGFLTHCGMNSTLEAVFAGVPMLTLPLFFDQPIDGRLIVDEWKVGLSLKDWMGKDGVIGRDDIVKAVKKFMDSDGVESKAIRRRALEWKEACQRAVGKGGSSYGNLSSFIENFCSLQ